MSEIDLHALRRELLSSAIAIAESMFPEDFAPETPRPPSQARQGFGPDGRPLCFNRELRREYLANDGLTHDGGQFRRRIPWAFSTDCKSWVADPSTDPVPLAEGWKCGGCVHFPSDAVDLALTRRHDRKLREAK